MRIPNKLTVFVMVTGLLWAFWAAGFRGLGEAFAGSLLTSLPFVVLFIYGGGGAGDAKLMGALGAWLGLIGGLLALVSVVMAGAVCGIAYAFAQGRLRSVVQNLRNVTLAVVFVFLLRQRMDRVENVIGESSMTKMPYGVPIFLGVCLAAVVRSVSAS